MIQLIVLIVYLALSYWVARQASSTRAGAIGTFLLCLLTTPVLNYIFFYVFQAHAAAAAVTEVVEQPQTVTITPVK